MKRLPFLLFALIGSVLVVYAQWQPTIIWERVGTVPNAEYGDQVFALGDQNDDGYADFGVSGYGNVSRVDLFHGGNPPSSTPYLSFHWDSTGYAFYIANSFGDVNGDGYLDWYVVKEAPFGTMHWEIYFGGLAADSLPDLVFLLPWVSAHQVSLARLGDFNGDGFDDIYRYDWMADLGQAYFGGNPMDTLVDWTCHRTATQQALPWSYGDLNGDGFSDWFSETVAAQPDQIWIFQGAVVPDSTFSYEITGGNGYVMGLPIVNDLNGDGRDEFLGAGTDALGISWGGEQVHDYPDRVLNDPCAAGGREQVFSIGDFNHDGYGDFVKTSESCNGGYWDGMAALYIGGPAPHLAAILDGEGPPLNVLGFSNAAGLGDVNGDGIDDLLLGSRQVNNLRGRAVVIAGDPLLGVGTEEPHAPLPDKLQVSVFPNPFNSRATVSLDVPASTSTVNLTLYNLLGQSVQQTTLSPVSGHTTHSLDASALSTGVYLLSVQAGPLHVTQKLMLLK